MGEAGPVRQRAELFPNATYLQCRKLFEQKRTAFGKIEVQEMRSGSAARPQTPREDDIMATWAFLTGHIVHAATSSFAHLHVWP